MKKTTLAFLMILAIAFSSVPVLTGAAAEEAPGSFVVGVAGKPTGDFFTNLWGNSSYDMDVRAMLHGYETVVFSEQYVFVPNPTAIESIGEEANDDGSKTYTLTVVPGLLYNDGTPITASDYVFGLLLQGSPQALALGGATMAVNHIQGFEAFNSGEAETFTGLRLVDERRFSITVKPETLPFFYELSMAQANPYPISVIAPGFEVADDGAGAYVRGAGPDLAEERMTADLLYDTLFDPETGYAAHPSVSSGPYEMVSFDAESGEARFTINRNFAGDWRGRKPAINNIVVVHIPPAEMVPALERGEVQLINKVTVGGDISDGLNSRAPIRSYLYPRQGFGFISFSCEIGPTRYEAVRKAVGYAFDREQFVAEFNQSYGIPVRGYYGIGQSMVQMILWGGPSDYAELTPEESEAWMGLSLEDLEGYAQNLDMAKALLADDGWTLNEAGEPFAEGVDEVRHKEAEGELIPLTLRFAKQKDNEGADLIVLMLVEPMAELGMKLEVIELTFEELLESYYRKGERLFHMAFLATNFSSVFDPYFVFSPDERLQGLTNTSGLMDEALAQSALVLRQTEPGDLLDYCLRWHAFQKVFGDKLPMLPLYSNIYFDFSTNELQGYDPNRELNWPNALLYATLGETDGGVDPGTEGFIGDGEFDVVGG